MSSDHQVTEKALFQAAGHWEPGLIPESNQAITFSDTAETGFISVCN